MTKRAIVLINSFRRKSGLHSVMSPRQILFGKKFKTPLRKMGELVLAYDVRANNKTSQPITHSMHCTLDQMMGVLVIRYLNSQQNK